MISDYMIGLITSVCLLLLGWVLARVSVSLDNRKKGDDAIIARLDEIEKGMAVLATQVSPMWTAVQQKISTDLHHPHAQFREMDALLTKLDALIILPEERLRLKVLLDERSRDMQVSAEERASAALMGQVMDKVIEEQKG